MGIRKAMLAAALLVGRMIIVLCFVFQLLAIGSLESKAGITKETPEGLVEAADEIVKESLKNERFQKMALQTEFEDVDSVPEFRLGKPYAVYELDIAALYDNEGNMDFNKALILSGWNIPIYIENEFKPKSIIRLWKKKDGKWHFAQLSGTALNINEARDIWPSKDGYLHALLTAEAFYLPRLVAVEKFGELNIYFFSQDSLLARDFGLSRNDEGYFPAISIEKFTSHIKKDEKYEREIKRIYNRNN